MAGKPTLRIFAALVLCLVLCLGLACGPVPGGRLSGEPAPVPADWSEVLGADRAFCEIESRPAEPHSIQLDCFLWEGTLYVQSHRWALARWWPVESWAAIWIEQPSVLLRIGGQLFEMNAQVEDGPLRSAILAARGYDPVPEGIVLFRFVPRL